MPIVFWASFAPCPIEYRAAEINWKERKWRSTKYGEVRANAQVTITTSRTARAKPTAGESTIPEAVLSTPCQTMETPPALVECAPSAGQADC